MKIFMFQVGQDTRRLVIHITLHLTSMAEVIVYCIEKVLVSVTPYKENIKWAFMMCKNHLTIFQGALILLCCPVVLFTFNHWQCEYFWLQNSARQMAHLSTLCRMRTISKRAKHKWDSCVFPFFPVSFNSILSIRRIAQAFVISNLGVPKALKPVSHFQFSRCPKMQEIHKDWVRT